jgi:hypothetical protein
MPKFNIKHRHYLLWILILNLKYQIKMQLLKLLKKVVNNRFLISLINSLLIVATKFKVDIYKSNYGIQIKLQIH